jgi:hypothetical protein
VIAIEGERNRDYLADQKEKLFAHLREGLLHQGEYKNRLRELFSVYLSGEKD